MKISLTILIILIFSFPSALRAETFDEKTILKAEMISIFATSYKQECLDPKEDHGNFDKTTNDIKIDVDKIIEAEKTDPKNSERKYTKTQIMFMLINQQMKTMSDSGENCDGEKNKAGPEFYKVLTIMEAHQLYDAIAKDIEPDNYIQQNNLTKKEN